MKKIALYEPFYKGSHKYWADSLIKHSRHSINLVSRNGVFWKWRVQQSSIDFELENNHGHDAILSTNMVNLAAWAGINKQLLGKTKLIHYFHENQLSYPVSETEINNNQQSRHFYGFIDITSALTADHVVFNSKYHRDSFLDGIRKLSMKLPDKIPASIIEKIFYKSTILPIGLDVEKFLEQKPRLKTKNDIPIILWNHRHEFDKNPKLFFETLFRIKEKGIQFQLVVLGKSPKKSDPIFKKAQDILKDEIICFGAVSRFEDYAKWLWRTDILPVTSDHDFFGISVLEAALCQNQLLLPNKNAYPDHFDRTRFKDCYFETESEFEEKLTELLIHKNYFVEESSLVPRQYSWSVVSQQYDNFF